MTIIPTPFICKSFPPPLPLGHEHSPQVLELSTMFATFHEHLLGTPDTNLKGLRTLNALKAFTSKLPELKNAFTKIVAILKGKFTDKKSFVIK